MVARNRSDITTSDAIIAWNPRPDTQPTADWQHPTPAEVTLVVPDRLSL